MYFKIQIDTRKPNEQDSSIYYNEKKNTNNILKEEENNQLILIAIRSNKNIKLQFKNKFQRYFNTNYI